MARRKVPSTRNYLADQRYRKPALLAQRRARTAAKDALRDARRQLRETERHLKRYERERQRGARANRRLFKRLVNRRDRGMLAIEKRLGTYRPKSNQLTRSRRSATRSVWKKTERLLNRFLSTKRPSKSHRRSPRAAPLRRVPTKTRGHRIRPIADLKLQLALRLIRQEKSIREAAQEINVPYDRLLEQLKSKGALKKKGSRWVLRDDLHRQMPIFSEGKALQVVVNAPKDVKIASAYMNAVKAFKRTRDPAYLTFFRIGTVTDIEGVAHPLEVDPNTVMRLSFTGDQSFEDVYRYVLP